MMKLDIPDPVFREAVAAIDAGDVPALERLLNLHSMLVRDRIQMGEGYFENPYLLWFVAENPVRNDHLPANIVDVTRAILTAAAREEEQSLPAQRDTTLGLVVSGRVAREHGVQLPLIDLLVDAGANPNCLGVALAHGENAAAERLLARGAKMTLLAAVCLDRSEEVERLLPDASAAERQLALAGAALQGKVNALGRLLAVAVNVNAFAPEKFHAHATPLHHAVGSGSLEAVRLLVEAGAALDTKDKMYDGTPLDWAVHLKRDEIAAYLRARTQSE